MDQKKVEIKITSRILKSPEKNYATKQKIISIVLCIMKYQNDPFKKKKKYRCSLQECKRSVEEGCKKFASKLICAK